MNGDKLQLQLPEMIVQSGEIVTTRVGGVPILELQAGSTDLGKQERYRTVVMAINFLRAGADAVQMVMLPDGSSQEECWNKTRGDIRYFVNALEVHDGMGAEKLQCEFNNTAFFLKMTRSIPPKK